MIDFFFAPEGVVFVGISTKPEREKFNVLQIVKAEGYQGRVYGVNPEGGVLAGAKLYRSVRELPEPVELAVLSVPREAVVSVLKECIAVGVKGVIIYTQGFADADATGKAMQEEITRLAKESGVRVVGPNSMGVTNAFDRFSTLFNYWSIPEQPAAVGVIAQTGYFTCSGLFTTGGIGLVIDLANAADVSFTEVISYYERDPRIKVIALHVEDIKEGREFIKVAREVSRHKPILAIKGGVSEVGKKAAASHCGALASDEKVYQAVFEQAGIIQVSDVEELHDLCKAFLYYSPIQNNRVAIVSPTGGSAIMVADACALFGLELAPLLPETLACLRRLTPDWFSPANPVDVGIASIAYGYQKIVQEVLEALMVDPNVDAVISVIPAISASGDDPYVRGVEEAVIPLARKKIKPVVCLPYGPCSQAVINHLDKNEILGFTGGMRAARVIAGLYRYGAIRNRPPFEYPLPVYRQEKELSIIQKSDQQEIDQALIERLEEYGVPVAETRFAPDLTAALLLAEEIGYPVVLKAFGTGISHKSDFGGVRLNIQSAEELWAAYKDLTFAVEKNLPGVTIEGVIIQPYLPGGVEVFLGFKQDPRFGPVVVYGSGGIFTEIIADVTFQLAPLKAAEAAQMIAKTKSFQLLRGARGTTLADFDSLVQVIVRVSRLAVDCPEIKELDLNPIAVFQRGVKVLDVRAIIKD